MRSGQCDISDESDSKKMNSPNAACKWNSSNVKDGPGGQPPDPANEQILSGIQGKRERRWLVVE
jgi:hypothetical protein